MVDSASIVAADLPKFFALLNEVPSMADKVRQSIEKYSFGVDTTKGLSLLTLKNTLFLDYLADVALIMLKKLDGRRIENDDAIDRIVEVRTYLEKMRPIERKMRYQVEKLVRVGTTGQVDASDPLLMRANPANMVAKVQDEDEDEEDEDESDEEDEERTGKPKKSNVYVPPKLSAVPFDEDGEPKVAREEKLAERSRKRMLNSAIMQELKAEYSDQPLEVFEAGHHQRRNQNNALRERTRFEEDNFTRLPFTKQEMTKKRGLSTVALIGDEVTDFGFGFSQPSKRDGPSSSKKQKLKTKGKAGKKFKKSSAKKRRFH